MKSNVSRAKKILIIGIIAVVLLSFAFEYFTNDARSIPKDQRVRIVEESMAFSCDYEKVLRIYTEYENGCEVTVDGVPKYVDSEARIIKEKKTDKGVNISSYAINEQGKEIRINNSDNKTQIIKVEIDNRYIFNYRYYIFALMLGILGMLALYFIIKNETKTEKVFLTVGLVVVIAMASLLPITTVNSWDEHIHYSWVRQTLPIKLSESDILLGNQEISWIFDTVAQDEIINSCEAAIDTNGFTAAKMAKGSNPVLHFYNYIAYYPSAVTIALTKTLGCKNSIAIIFGRIANGLLYILLCYLGIRRLKSGKVLGACVALIPLALFQASVYTYDWWVTSFIFCGCAMLLAELQEPESKMEKTHYFAMLAILVLGCGPKAIYFPVILLLLLMPKNKYRSIKQWKISNAIIIGSAALVLMSFLLPFLIGGPGMGDSRAPEGTNSTGQLAFIFGKPLEYTVILLKAIASYIMPKGIAYSIAELGYIVRGKTAIVYAAGIIVLLDILLAAFCDRKDCDRSLLSCRNRIWVYLSIFAIICLIETALYISYTPVGGDIILGVQRRYMLPMFMLGFSMLGSKAIINKVKTIPIRFGIVAVIAPAGITLLEFGYLVVINYF